ncbi:unnamed protein product [marine sediment metagenome]|uniref:Uncharacterized protein n=1 Tax=marine sediment metagenome TaxID=412755 RepID=X0SG82_9ZZZZ
MEQKFRHNAFAIEEVEQVTVDGVPLTDFAKPQLEQMVAELLRTLKRREEVAAEAANEDDD